MKTLNNIFDKIDAVMKAVVLASFALMVLGFASCEDDMELTEQQTASLVLPGVEEHEGIYAVNWQACTMVEGGCRYANDTTYFKVSKQTGDSLANIAKEAFLKNPTMLGIEIGSYNGIYVGKFGDELPGKYTAKLEYDARRQAVVLTLNGDHIGHNHYTMRWYTPDLADTKTWKLITGLDMTNTYIHE